MKANHELNIRNQNENCFMLIRTHKRQQKKNILMKFSSENNEKIQTLWKEKDIKIENIRISGSP